MLEIESYDKSKSGNPLISYKMAKIPYFWGFPPFVVLVSRISIFEQVARAK